MWRVLSWYIEEYATKRCSGKAKCYVTDLFHVKHYFVWALLYGFTTRHLLRHAPCKWLTGTVNEVRRFTDCRNRRNDVHLRLTHQKIAMFHVKQFKYSRQKY